MTAIYVNDKWYSGHLEYKMDYADGHLVLISYYRNFKTIEQMVKKDEDTIKRYILAYVAETTPDVYMPYVVYQTLIEMNKYIDYLIFEIQTTTYDLDKETHHVYKGLLDIRHILKNVKDDLHDHHAKDLEKPLHKHYFTP